MKPLAIVLFAVLALSFIPLLAGQQSAALSAVTFTSLETVTSQGTGTFQRVYENGTSSLVFSDSNRTAAYFKSSYNIATDTLDTDVTTLTNTTYTATAFGYNSPVDLSRYALETNGNSQYGIASGSSVFDITNQDFSWVGMYYRTGGGTDNQCDIISKNAFASPHYRVHNTVTTNKLRVTLTDSVDTVTLTTTASLTNGQYWIWGFAADRSDNLSVWLYNTQTQALETLSSSITAVGSLTNGNTFTVSRNADSANLYCQGYQDDLMFFDGTAITQEQFLEYVGSGEIDGIAPSGHFDFNEGIAGATIEDVAGNNNLSPQGSPSYVSTVTSSSSSRLSTYIIGRDDNSDVVGVAKLNTADLSEVDDEYFSSNYFPKDIVQSTNNLYVPMYDNATGSGNLKLASITRQFGSYAENSLYSGTESVPAHGVNMNVTVRDSSVTVRSGAVTIAGERATSSSILINKYIDKIDLFLSRTGAMTGNMIVGVFNSAGTTVFSCASKEASTLTTSAVKYSFMCAGQYQIQADDRIGIKYTGSDAANSVNVFYNAANVFDGANSIAQQYEAGWSNAGGVGGDIEGAIVEVVVKSVVYDNEVSYHVFESGASSIRIAKYSGSGSLLGTALTHLSGKPFAVSQLSDRVIVQTNNATYQLLTSSDAISQVYSTTFLTKPAQTFTRAPAGTTFNSAALLLANATYAIEYVPSTGASSRTGVLIDSIVTGASGTLAGYDPAKFYMLTQNDLVVDAASVTATSWTIREPSSREQLVATAYTEALNIDLVENTTSILAQDVIELSCDNGNYLVEIQYFAVGSDADCNLWEVLADSSATVGRQLFSPYDPTPELVHADPLTGYTFEIIANEPDSYTLYSSYDSKTVDVAEFDSAGQAQQRYLYGQCYRVQVTNEDTGNSALIGNICANDATTKSINIDTVTVPTNWQGHAWSWNLQRDYSDPDDNSLVFTVEKSVTPYNASIHIVNNLYQNSTVDEWYNFTGQTGQIIVSNNGYFSNNTLWITVWENGDVVIRTVSAGKSFSLDDWSAPFGPVFGISMMGFFVVIIAGVFPRSMGTIAIIAVLATAGIMWTIGWLDDLPVVIWPGLIGLAAIGIMADRRRT